MTKKRAKRIDNNLGWSKNFGANPAKFESKENRKNGKLDIDQEKECQAYQYAERGFVHFGNKDDTTAVSCYKKALEIYPKSAYARIFLSWMHLHGLGVNKDRGKSLELLQNAEPNPGVSICIGLMRLHGYGCEKRSDLAKINFLRAYSMGNLIAFRMLSHVMKAEGKYVQALCVEFRALLKIIPVYRKNKYDGRLWAPWVSW